MDVAKREAQVRKFVDQVWNARNYDAAADLYGEAYTNALGSGPEARSAAIRRYHQAFPDLRLDVDELIVLVTRWCSGPRSAGRTRADT